MESLTADITGNLYLSGSFEGSIDMDPGIGIFIMNSSGSTDGYIEKLNSDGSFQWAIQIGGADQDIVYSSTVDLDGNVYSTGFFMSEVDFNPGIGTNLLTSLGSNDSYVQKLDTDGNYQWAKSFGGDEGEIGFGIALDELNNVYTTGYFQETVDFNPNAGIFNLTVLGSSDIFIQKLDTEGEFIWAKSIGGTDTDQGSTIQLDSEGDIYLIGRFEEIVDFNFGDAESNLESEGSGDIFILKLNACSPNDVTDEITSCISYTWSNGITYYEDNNSATQTLLNIDGCDSVVTLDLTINEVDITTTALGGVITSNATGASYQWLDCNDDYSEIDGETSASYTPTGDGDYAVKITLDDCTDTSECVAIDGVGINESSGLLDVKVYPNPSNGQFYIDLGETQVISMRIYSINGDLVYTANNLNGGLHAFELAVEHGLYFVDVIAAENRGQFKLVIE
ncbi:MAG: T9SS type A sorting domain-containing protein [Crocinitomix sp.]|nr:T9SS type A sorting domain-containing protein [Crocinitomix sp.]